MVEFIEKIVLIIEGFGIWGGLIGSLFILIESILPVLPLFVFITLNFICFGSLIGFFMSWLFTILGCLMSYNIFSKGLSDKFYNKVKDKEKLKTYTEKFKNISLGTLAVIVAIPFTPAFLVNIAAGLAKMEKKKFLIGIMIGKVALVYFWGYVGSSLIESIKNPIILIRIGIMLLITYIISLIANKVLKL